MLRIVVAEDSPTARRLLVEILRSDPELQVVGEAHDGQEALELTRRLRPDLVTMDIHMPNMDGLEATRRIMEEVPTPVVVVSTLVERDVRTAMQALKVGALAVQQKLVGPASPDFETESRRLRDTLKAMAAVKVVRRWPGRAEPGPRPAASAAAAAPGVTPARARPAVLAIAASTGGPAALQQILSGLHPRVSQPILVVQHIALGFSQGLADWLGMSSGRPVAVARDGEQPRDGHVYIAPDDRHLGLHPDRTLQVSGAAPTGGFRPSATFLFRSVAQALGPQALALVLTGMGQDGVEGLRAVREGGGRVLAQDEASSIVWGMPGTAHAAGLVDELVPLERLAVRLAELAG